MIQKESGKITQHPLRKKIIQVGIPAYLFVILLVGIGVLLDVVLLGAGERPGVLSIVAVGIFVAASVMLPVLSKKVEKLEIAAQQQRFSYLLKPQESFEKECITVCEEGVTYTLMMDGMKVQYPERGGQVFDEVREDVEFIPWDKADVFLATKSENRIVHIAMAVFKQMPLVTVFDAEKEENTPIQTPETAFDTKPSSFFLPMTEELYGAMLAFGLKEKMAQDFDYLLYNPDDAFRQIFKKGRIVEMRNKKTGKLFVDAHGNFIGDK
ncbi:MAG: hypothetical protein IJX87_00710 [Clostridia bacterium]|nr:hypothetical protein [Clostridia bacterium]